MTLPFWVRVGAKCVCVNARGTPWLTEGAKYTIGSISHYSHGSYFVISELPPEVQDGWYPWRFKPAVDDTDEAIERDAELFRHHLTTPLVSSTERVRAEVSDA
jgi:hypothetical protein